MLRSHIFLLNMNDKNLSINKMGEDTDADIQARIKTPMSDADLEKYTGVTADQIIK